jgi:hypothetical protein
MGWDVMGWNGTGWDRMDIIPRVTREQIDNRLFTSPTTSVIHHISHQVHVNLYKEVIHFSRT